MAGKQEPKFSHLDAEGQAAMVDVSDKPVSERTATARCTVLMQPETIALIPLCHPLNVTSIKVELTVDAARDAVDISATVKVDGKTGVEMEALTAASVAALTVYDMVKAVDRGTTITDVRLVHKAGGKSGDFRAD
jgi:cyclic pyranopterin phosphate synthase